MTEGNNDRMPIGNIASEDDFFPDSPRVIYERCPLAEVICQLRFPPVLRIEGQPPADFQDRVRDIFPLLERGNQLTIPQIPSNIAQLIGSPIGNVQYIFMTENGENKLALTPQAISLTTKNYTRWEHFWGQFNPALDALMDIYKPSFFNRIGLRYQNAILREVLDLAGRPWSELLGEEILGELALPQFENNLDEARRVIRVRIPSDDSGLFLQHGLGTVEGHAEKCYLIDLDLYTHQKIGVRDAEPILNRFHRRAGRAFRWCISRALHDALRPRPVDDVADDAHARYLG
jgi:uncharacterized protein (TIGR04255 family)